MDAFAPKDIVIPNPLINCSILILKSRIGFGHYLMELVLMSHSDMTCINRAVANPGVSDYIPFW